MGVALRGEPWGAPRFNFELALITLHGIPIGWGATCGRHKNDADQPRDPECKKQVTYGQDGLADTQCRSILKQWLLKGLDCDGHANARKMHVKEIHARRLDVSKSEAAVDLELDALPDL